MAGELSRNTQEEQADYIQYLENFEELYQEAPCGYVSHLPDGTIIRINDTLLRWLGYTREEVINRMKITDFFDFGGKIFYQTHHFPLLKLQGMVRELNYNLIDREKSTLPVLISATTVRNTKGKIVLSRCTVFDISERKKYERELLRAKEKAEEAERRLRFMAESIPALVWTMEANGELDYYSRKFYDCTGKDFGNDAVKRADWGLLLHPRDREKTYNALDYALNNGIEYKIDHRIQNKDGGYTWMQSRAVPYRDDKGEIIKWFGATIDIDEEVKAHEAIRAAQAQLKLVINTIPAVLTYVDKDYYYRMANKVYEEWVGKNPDEVVNHPVEEILGTENFLRLKPYMDRAFKGETVTFEHVLTDNAGEKRIVKVNYNPDKHGRRVKGFVSFVHDITKEKQFEQVLENEVKTRTQKLEQANFELIQSNQDLEQFAYVASHDLKEPLRMISIYTQVIINKLQAAGIEMNEYAGFVEEGVVRMKSMIDDLLEYSRIDRKSLNFHVVDMQEVIEGVLGNLNNEILSRNAVIEFADLPEVYSSKSLMTHLIQNLVSNALKFTRENTSPEICIKANKEGDEWLFSVIDNGIGINPDYQKKVFQIFQRLNARNEYEGTGIGLALCKRIIDLHGGRIWFEPNTKGGTIFNFTIPDELP